MTGIIDVRMSHASVGGSDALALAVEIIVHDAASKEDALTLVNRAMKMLAGGKRAFIRVWPDANSDREFETGITRHTGYARFTFMDVAGDWENSEFVVIRIPSLGDAKSKDAA